jgi:hypothetical protein
LQALYAHKISKKNAEEKNCCCFMWKNTLLDLPKKTAKAGEKNQQTKENKLKPLNCLNV